MTPPQSTLRRSLRLQEAWSENWNFNESRSERPTLALPLSCNHISLSYCPRRVHYSPSPTATPNNSHPFPMVHSTCLMRSDTFIMGQEVIWITCYQSQGGAALTGPHCKAKNHLALNYFYWASLLILFAAVIEGRVKWCFNCKCKRCPWTAGLVSKYLFCTLSSYEISKNKERNAENTTWVL